MSHFCRYKNVNQRKKYHQKHHQSCLYRFISHQVSTSAAQSVYFQSVAIVIKNLNNSSSDRWAIRRLSLGKSSVFEQVRLFGMKSGIFTNVWNTPPKTLFGIFYTISKSGQYQCIHTSLSSTKQGDDTRLYH